MSSTLASMPEAARPAAETAVTLADAARRWPETFALCLERLHGLAPQHATTADHHGQQHLFLWAAHPALPGDTEVAGAAPLPPSQQEVRELLHEIAWPELPAPTGATVG